MASQRSSSNGQTPDPVGELRWNVSLPGGAQIGDFAECSGLTVEYDVMDYQEGGELTYTHKLRGGVKYPNIVLKRGVTHEENLLKWLFDRSERDSRGQITITLYADDAGTVRTWSFQRAFPIKWTGPSLNAKSTSIATETLEIQHQGMVPPS